MSKYVLSKETENDIDEIFEFGEYKFGYDQAITYLIGLEEHFEALATNSKIGKKPLLPFLPHFFQSFCPT